MEAKRLNGSTAECISHLAGLLPAPGTRTANDARKPLADFVGNSPATIWRWFTDKTLPTGEAFLRLKFMLQDLLGYTVIELQDVPEPFLHLGRMIAYRAIAIDNISAKLSFVDNNSILRFLRGGSSTTSERMQIIEQLWSENQKKVEDERARWRERLSNLRLSVERSSGIQSSPGSEPSTPGTGRGREEVSRAAAGAGEIPNPLLRSFATLVDGAADLSDQAVRLVAIHGGSIWDEVDREAATRLAKNIVDLLGRA